MSDEVLKPCPICGKKMSIARTENEVGERWWFITRGTYRTTRCNCHLFLESEVFTCGWNDDYSLECRAKLIDKWNTRAELGSGTCEMYRDNCGTWHCKSCEHGADTITGSDGVLESWSDSWPPNFCPNCGAKVVER